MRRIVNKRELAHLWAHQTQSEAYTASRNFYFQGPTIYSYGTHFPIAKIVEGPRGKAVLVTYRGYSSTTAQHINLVRRAIPPALPEMFVKYPDRSFEEGLASFDERIKDATDEVLAPRIRKATRASRFERVQKLVNEANAYAVFFKLKRKFVMPPDIETLAVVTETERKKAEERARRQQAQQIKAHQATIVQIRKDSQDKIAEWLAGGRVHIPMGLPEAYLRVQESEVETSKGATFPVDHARKALAMLQHWTPGTELPNIRLGYYRIDSIRPNGDIIAGCHVITAGEVARFAEVLKNTQ